MLQDVEVLSGRRALRRRVDMSVAILGDSFGRAMPHQATELSETGVWVECDYPLSVGERVTVSLTPPSSDEPMVLHGSVRRVAIRRRQSDPQRGAGMAIAFHHFTDAHEELLAESLHGIPPKLPAKRRAVETDWVWVDELLTYEEVSAEGDDQRHDEHEPAPGTEVSEHIGDLEGREIEFSSLAGALHAARPRWV